MYNRNQREHHYSHSLKNIEIIEKPDYLIIKHNDPSCPRRFMRDSFVRKHKRIVNGEFSDQFDDIKSLKIETYKQKDEYKSPNTVKFSLIGNDNDNLPPEIKKKKLLEVTYKFLRKHQVSFFSDQQFSERALAAQEASLVTEPMTITELEKSLQTIDQECAALMTAKNTCMKKIQVLSSMMKFLTTELANYDMLKLKETIIDTEIDLMNAQLNAADPSFLAHLLEMELEKFRQHLMAKEQREVHPDEVMAYFGEDFIGNHLLKVKYELITAHMNIFQELQDKLAGLQATESKYQNYDQNLRQLEVQYSNLCSELENITQKIMCKEHDRNVVMQNFKVGQQAKKTLSKHT